MLEFVLPEERNRADVLDFYREFEESGGSCIGFDRLLLVCDEDNAASQKVVLRNEGTFTD